MKLKTPCAAIHSSSPAAAATTAMGFFDLSIPYLEADRHVTTDKSSLNIRRLKVTLKSMELGYTGVAYNRTIKGVMSESSRCSIPLFTLSKLGPSSSSSFTSAVEFHRGLLNVPLSSPFRQYTRLTVVVDSPTQAAALNSGNPILKTYDIIAVRPMNQNVFDQACQTSEVHMIAIDFAEKLPFRLKQHMVKAAIKRGVYFEITYSGLIVDPQSRRQMISNCKLLVDWTRGKNLLFSSAAPSATELRGPQDVANLVSLLGLSMERAKAAISKNCRSLLAKALRKKHFYKEAVKVEEIPTCRQSNPNKSPFDDWRKWDPISSGEGDLLLDDMKKSFSMINTKTKSVKTIEFTSAMNGLPVHGLQIKDLISVTKAANESVDMETEETVTVCENPDSHNPLPEDQVTLPENHGISDALTKEQEVFFLPEDQNLSISVLDINETSSCQDPDFPSDSLPKERKGNQASGSENLTSFPTYLDIHCKSEETVSLSSEKLNCLNKATEMQLQDTQLQRCKRNALPDGGKKVTTIKDKDSLIVADHVSIKLSNYSSKSMFQLEGSNLETRCDLSIHAEDGMDKVPNKIDGGNKTWPSVASSDATSQDILVKEDHLSKSMLQLEDSNLENRYDLSIYTKDGVDKVPNKINGGNKTWPSVASSDATSQDILVVEDQYMEMTNTFEKSSDGLHNIEFLNSETKFNEAFPEAIMAEHRQTNSDQGTRREKRKRNPTHQPLLFPFKRFLNPKPAKRRHGSKSH